MRKIVWEQAVICNQRVILTKPPRAIFKYRTGINCTKLRNSLRKVLFLMPVKAVKGRNFLRAFEIADYCPNNSLTLPKLSK